MPRSSSFTELTKGFSPERRERIERLRQDMTLAERRKAFPLTQHTGQNPQCQTGRDLQDRESGRHADEHPAQFCAGHGW